MQLRFRSVAGQVALHHETVLHTKERMALPTIMRAAPVSRGRASLMQSGAISVADEIILPNDQTRLG